MLLGNNKSPTPYIKKKLHVGLFQRYINELKEMATRTGGEG